MCRAGPGIIGRGRPISELARAALLAPTASLALQGMGGVGKSVLAAALARDPALQAAFPDGILWITLGLTPNVALRQADLAESLGEKDRHFPDEQRGKLILRELLQDKACLLILDDVWQTAHAAAFDCLGPAGRLLITTRDAGLAQSLGARLHSLDVFGPAEALELLAHWAGQSPETLPPEAARVAQECGYLPLALAMAGALVQRGPELWGRTLRRLQNADLDKLKRDFPDYPYPDLWRAIQVSVEALPAGGAERYADLAVFTDETPVPAGVLQTLWRPTGWEADDAADFLDLLVDRALARRDDQGRLTLHDLQRDYVRRQNAGLSPPCTAGCWTRIPRCCPSRTTAGRPGTPARRTVTISTIWPGIWCGPRDWPLHQVLTDLRFLEAHCRVAGRLCAGSRLSPGAPRVGGRGRGTPSSPGF